MSAGSIGYASNSISRISGLFMPRGRHTLSASLGRPARFLHRVLRGFRHNQGLLLSGAVAYYGLLSIIPLLALLLVALSHFMDEATLVASIRDHLEFVLPVHAEELTQQIAAFLEHRHVVGWIGMLVLIFFSTMAFTVLENAMSVIFLHRVAIHRRHFMVSAVIPFSFILLVGLGLILITIISGVLHGLEDEQVRVFGLTWQLSGLSGLLLYLLGVLGLALLLTSLYMVMPVGHLALRHAFAGGLAAALLWEIARHVLVWYFARLSLVNVVYGSFATVIVILISFELGALILLLGAQVIAELERGEDDGDFET